MPQRYIFSNNFVVITRYVIKTTYFLVITRYVFKMTYFLVITRCYIVKTMYFVYDVQNMPLSTDLL